MDLRDYGPGDAEKFRFEMERDDFPMHLEAAVEPGTGIPLVVLTVQSAGVRITQPLSADEARAFAGYLTEFASSAERMAAK